MWPYIILFLGIWWHSCWRYSHLRISLCCCSFAWKCSHSLCLLFSSFGGAISVINLFFLPFSQGFGIKSALVGCEWPVCHKWSERNFSHEIWAGLFQINQWVISLAFELMLVPLLIPYYRCHHCCEVLYCSPSCREKAWVQYHKVECSLGPLLKMVQYLAFVQCSIKFSFEWYFYFCSFLLFFSLCRWILLSICHLESFW